jgi:hypothetical protein
MAARTSTGRFLPSGGSARDRREAREHCDEIPAVLLAGNLPTPLYAVYRARFGFSGTELTLIFAVYARR